MKSTTLQKTKRLLPTAVCVLGFALPIAAQVPAVAAQPFQSADSAATWQAKWIAAPWSTVRDGAELDGSRPMPIFRRDFTLREAPQSAVLRIAGLGQWSASVDGQPLIAGAGLHGSWTDYRKRIEFREVPLPSLSAGTHALGVTLGNGMYNVQRTKGRYTKFEGSFGEPMLTAELRVRYRDGREEVIATDHTWSAAKGPVLFNSIYGGEDFDARSVQPGWDKPAFTNDHWTAAQEVTGPGGRLMPAVEPDVLAGAEYRAVSVKQLTPGRTVYDLGQNFAGVVRIRVAGPAGAVLKLTPAELLNPDGTVSQASSGKGMWWSYTLRGDDVEEVWRPQFSYYGFRYVQAEWLNIPEGAQPRVIELVGEEIHSASPATGTLETSDDTLNRIHSLVVHAMHNNEVSLFTDCPHREKLGWLEQTHLVAAGLMFNNDVEALYRETARNMADAQDASGMVPTIAPQYTRFGPKYPIYDDSPEWGSAAVLAPWAAFRFYGDRDELAHNYPMMQRWTHYLESRAENGIVSYGLGDWYDNGPNPPGFAQNTTAGVTGTLMLVECAQAMDRIATLLGKPDDAVQYRALAQREVAAFQARFWDAAHGWYDTGSQTANAMPLALGIVPTADRARAIDHLIADIHAHNDHTTAGEIGFPYELRALHESGRDDVVLEMASRPDPPSYASQLAAGATSLTEAWDANPHNSQDHFMLGSIENWFYGALAGIDIDMSRTNPAQRITIRPSAAEVPQIRATYASKLGPISVSRNVQEYTITVPVRSTIVLPLSVAKQKILLEKGTHWKRAKPNHADEHAATFEVAAGTYHFRMEPPPK